MKVDARDKGLLLDIIDYCEKIAETVVRFGDSFEKFEEDQDYKDSICMKILQIGEATNQVSEELKNKNQDTPWDKIYGMRNRLAHAYIKVDDEIIWDTVKTDIPNLKNKLEEII